MTEAYEQIRNNKRRYQWRHKACPASIERHGKACADLKLVWNAPGPVEWKVYELCQIKRSNVPVAVAFEIDWLIKVLEC